MKKFLLLLTLAAPGTMFLLAEGIPPMDVCVESDINIVTKGLLEASIALETSGAREIFQHIHERFPGQAGQFMFEPTLGLVRFFYHKAPVSNKSLAEHIKNITRLAQEGDYSACLRHLRAMREEIARLTPEQKRRISEEYRRHVEAVRKEKEEETAALREFLRIVQGGD